MPLTQDSTTHRFVARTRRWPGHLLTGRWLARSGFVCAYLVASFFLLRPILGTYVIADDFEAPFSQVELGARGLFSTINFAWQDFYVTHGDRTRVVGGVIGALVNWAWLWAAKILDVSILDVFGFIRYAVIVACAMGAATLWWQTARTYFRPVRWPTALVLVSVVLFGTLQLHGIWSNDPVESYPMAGFASAAIGFGLLSLAVWTSSRPTPRRFLVTAVAGLLAVSYYEFNLGAVLGSVLILTAAAWRYRRNGRRLIGHLALTGGVLLLPVLWMLIAGAQNSGATYNGRALQVSGALHSLWIGLVSSLPGAGWHVTSTTLGGYPPLTLGAAVVAVVIVAVVVAWLRWGPRDPRLVVSTPNASTPNTSRSLLMVVAVALAVGIYAVFAIGLEGATQKVELEVTQIGDVYTAYAVGSAAVALALAVGAWLLAAYRGRGWRWALIAVIPLSIAFITFQGSYNEHLKDILNVNIAENQQLDNAFAAGVTRGVRCASLRSWISYPWPDYYREQVFEGTETGYRLMYGSLMCPTMVAPADGFGPEYNSPTGPGWWLIANTGAIDLRTPDCSHGCSGTLHFSAGGLAVPHHMTLSTGAMKAVQLDVPDHMKRFAVKVRLTGTYTIMALTASGQGVTPASVHAGPGTIPDFVNFTHIRFVRS